MSSPTPDLLARSKWTTAHTASSRKTTATDVVVLGPMVKDGVYVLRSSEDAFYLQGASDVSCTTSTGHPIFAKEGIDVFCDHVADNGYVAVVLASGTGVAWLSRVD